MALAEKREHAIDYYLAQFRMHLETNMDDYINNYAQLPTTPDAT